MQIYWTLRSIPELSGLPSDERRRVWWDAYRKTTRHWQYWAGLVGMAACMEIGRHIYEPIGGYIGCGRWRLRIFAGIKTLGASIYSRPSLT